MDPWRNASPTQESHVSGRHRAVPHRHRVSRVRKMEGFVAAATAVGIAGTIVVNTAMEAHAADGGVNWDAVASCESGGNWGISTGNGFFGGLQFTLSTWRANGGTGMPQNASREAQIAVANSVLRTQGIGAWPVCGKLAGAAIPRHVAPPAPAIPLPSNSPPKHAAPVQPAIPVPATQNAPKHAALEVTIPTGPTVDYVVGAGDTLSAIADAHRVDGGWPALATLNNLSDPDELSVGQHLKLLTTDSPPAAAPAPVSAPLMPTYAAGVINTAGDTITAITGKPITLPQVAPTVSAAVAPSAFTQPAGKPAPAVAPVGIAARAISAAVGQTGTRYVYGGAAPGGFDCSGLVMWAFKQAGISLPRTAAAQSTVGRPVSLQNLQPGDLLFYYRPVDHVVMYVGNGKVVEASQPGTPVHVRPMYLNGFVEARRIA